MKLFLIYYCLFVVFPALPLGLAGGPGQQVWPTGWLPDLTRPILDRTNPVRSGHSSANQVSTLAALTFSGIHLDRGIFILNYFLQLLYIIYSHDTIHDNIIAIL